MLEHHCARCPSPLILNSETAKLAVGDLVHRIAKGRYRLLKGHQANGGEQKVSDVINAQANAIADWQAEGNEEAASYLESRPDLAASISACISCKLRGLCGLEEIEGPEVLPKLIEQTRIRPL